MRCYRWLWSPPRFLLERRDRYELCIDGYHTDDHKCLCPPHSPLDGHRKLLDAGRSRSHGVHQRYLSVYAYAFEWVELPADGGFTASKPYAASGAYINRMSDYCASCRYDVAKKTGKDACPLNALYWDFLDRNSETLSSNHRLTQIGASWHRMDDAKKQAFRENASLVLQKLDAVVRV